MDKETLDIRKLEGNPLHPASRGRNCAKGPATLNQVNDPERILYPLKRVGKRGEGQWQRVSWDEVLNDIAGRIRRALPEGRADEVMYHVGRPGHDGYMDRVLQAWGIDGHNSHTNVCHHELSHHELSFLLPHFLKEGRGQLSVYFTRVYNPVWTNPDWFSWIFEHSIPGLPEKATAEGLIPYDYMRKYGAFLVEGHLSKTLATVAYAIK